MSKISETQSAALSRIFRQLSEYTFPTLETINNLLKKVGFVINKL